MTLADQAIEFVSNEYILAKNENHQTVEWQGESIIGTGAEGAREVGKSFKGFGENIKNIFGK